MPNAVLSFTDDVISENLEAQVPRMSARTIKARSMRRIAAFEQNLRVFLDKCKLSDIDPVAELVMHAEKFYPTTTKSLQQPQELSPNADTSSLESLIPELMLKENYRGQIVEKASRTIPEQAARYAELEFDLPRAISNAVLKSRGINRLFIHQAEAINNLHRGHNVVVATPTASGKSLIYQIPVLNELTKDDTAKFFFVFPTKALAQDQKKAISDLLSHHPTLCSIKANTFDGDTPQEERRAIIESCSIILTNPDMLHISILPNESHWRSFLQSLRLVVIDELHIYTGTFGTHVSFVIRRLLRLCSSLGNTNVQFVSCSATIGDPLEHMKKLTNSEDVRLIDEDGSPSGKKHFICWNPITTVRGMPATSCLSDAASLLAFLMLKGVRTIAFCKVRKVCEMLLKATRGRLGALGHSSSSNKVMSYRGGYPATVRRRIEKDMFDGALLGIIATTALELGIDIGSLDAVLVVGFPYNLANMKQEIGRAGRRAQDSLAVFIADRLPIDQHFVHNPDDLFKKPDTPHQINVENTLIIESHMQCAAAELPVLPERDEQFFGSQCAALTESHLVAGNDQFFYSNPRYLPNPAVHVPIRTTEDGKMLVVDVTDGRFSVLDELEPSRTLYSIYEGAIYLNQGQSYLVKKFADDGAIAEVVRVRVNWTTRPRDFERIHPLQASYVRQLASSSFRCFYGKLRLSCCVYGYFKVDSRNRILDAVELDKIVRHYVVSGCWIDVPLAAIEKLVARRHSVAASIHAAEHAIMTLIPHFVASGTLDTATECRIAERDSFRGSSSMKRAARLTFYDRTDGSNGCGTSFRTFQFLDKLIRRAYQAIFCCNCTEEQGCPRCTISPNCSGQISNKVGAAVILRTLMGEDVAVDSIPLGHQPSPQAAVGLVQFVETNPKTLGKEADITLP